MKARLAALTVSVNALSLRERVILLGVCLVVVFTLWFTLLFDPLYQRATTASEEGLRLSAQSQELEARLITLRARAKADPNAPIRERIAALQGDVAEVDARLKEKTLELISPAQMAQVLEDMLAGKKGLTLIGMHSEPPRIAQGLIDEDLIEPPGQAGVPEDLPKVYEHGLVVELQGPYLDVLGYVQSLEALPWRLFWDDLRIETENYPRARIRLRLHTLSLREGWIGV